MELIVGDFSTWSMRAWLCLRMADISFSEVIVPLDRPDSRQLLVRYSDSGLVPVLNTGEFKVHDSLAIAEYCNEIAGGNLLPRDVRQRAECRSLVCELHAGFSRIRTTMPFAWNPAPVATLPVEAERECQRLDSIWGKARGPFYYEQPSMADAFYAVMACRLSNYGIRFGGAAGEYQTRLQEWPLFVELLKRARLWTETAAG